METQQIMEAAFKSFDSSKWNELVWQGENTYYYFANGVIDHDIYHIGQIVFQHKKRLKSYYIKEYKPSLNSKLKKWNL